MGLGLKDIVRQVFLLPSSYHHRRLHTIMNPRSYRPVAALLSGLFGLLCMFPAAVYAAPASESTAIERFEAKFAEERKARDKANAAEQTLVLGQLRLYKFPIQESQCAKFVVDWSEVTTVQAFIDVSSKYSKQLGNCLHQETETNVQNLVQYLVKEDLGTVSWHEDRLPDSIRLIPTMLSFYTNYERCSRRCYDRATGLVNDAVSQSKKAQADFLARWDLYFESLIKPVLKGGDPEAYEREGMEEQWSALRGLFEMYAFKRHQPNA